MCGIYNSPEGVEYRLLTRVVRLPDANTVKAEDQLSAGTRREGDGDGNDDEADKTTPHPS